MEHPFFYDMINDAHFWFCVAAIISNHTTTDEREKKIDTNHVQWRFCTLYFSQVLL